MARWTLDKIRWEQFDPSRVDPDILKLVKAASLVEYNAQDYAAYLCNVFPDDPRVQATVKGWAEEEVQHGKALGKWAELADPGFDFEQSFARFREGYRIPVEATESVRGSRLGELVARCVVEVGTSSYYTTLKEAVEEPVLKEICRNIAADEFHHYAMFHHLMAAYEAKERLSTWARLKVALGRVNEVDDRELAYAWHCANGGDAPFDQRQCHAAYGGRAYSHYRPHHVRRMVAMVLKAAGLPNDGWLAVVGSKLAWWQMRWNMRQFSAAA